MRTVAPLLVLPLAIGVCRADRLLVDPANDSETWVANDGGEFPGASVQLGVVNDPDRGPVVEGKFSFAGESRYAGVQWCGTIESGDSVGCFVRMADRDGGMIRVRDATDQEFMGSFRVKRGEWTEVTHSLTAESFGAHWGGANDGKLHFPLKAILLAASRGPDEAEMRVANLFVEVPQVSAKDRWRISIKPSIPCGVAFRGEAADYTVTVTNRVRTDEECLIRVWTQAPGSKPRLVWRGGWTRIAGWESRHTTVRLSTEKVGYWSLTVQREDPETGECSEGATSGLCVVPRPRNYGKPAPDCYFGMQSIPDMEVAERLGCKAVREAPGWRWAEPRQGDIRFEKYLDGCVNRCVEHQMVLLLTLQAIAPGWAAWQNPPTPNCGELPDPSRMDDYRRFVQAVAERYKGKITAIEIQNEPDLTCWYQPGLTREQGYECYERLLRAGRAGAKAGDPDVLVAGLDVSGGDFDGNLWFTTAILERASDQLDLYTGHPYSGTRYFGPGKSSLWPQQNRMDDKCRMALDLLERHGKPRHMWIGELGWGLDNTQPPLSEYSLQFAACMAQALILGKTVPGVDKFLWFTLQGCNEGGNEYGLLRGQPSYPLPAASAYATCAYLLDATGPGELRQVTNELSCARFTCESRRQAIIAWWSQGDEVRVAPPTQAGKWYDSYLREIRAGETGVLVGRLPVYWVLPIKDAASAIPHVRVEPAEPLRIDSLRMATLDRVGATLTNRTNRRLAVTLGAEGAQAVFELSPGAAREYVELPLPKSVVGDARTELPVWVEVEGRRETRAAELMVTVLPGAPASFTADGDLSEWPSPAPISLSERRDVLPPDPHVGWNGPDDLSIRAWLAADEKTLYYAAEVADDVHAAPSADPDGFWNSDSIQIAIDPLNDGGQGFGADDIEIGLVLGPQGPRVLISYPAPRRQIESPLGIRREGTKTLYEAAIPWTMRPGQVFGLDFIANDNDGQGRSYWIGLTPGIGEGKTPEVYRRFAVR